MISPKTAQSIAQTLQSNQTGSNKVLAANWRTVYLFCKQSGMIEDEGRTGVENVLLFIDKLKGDEKTTKTV